jgi:hypothetical protein
MVCGYPIGAIASVYKKILHKNSPCSTETDYLLVHSHGSSSAQSRAHTRPQRRMRPRLAQSKLTNVGSLAWSLDMLPRALVESPWPEREVGPIGLVPRLDPSWCTQKLRKQAIKTWCASLKQQ